MIDIGWFLVMSLRSMASRFDGRDWCWVRIGESQLHARHVSRRVKHGDGAILVCSCMTSCGTGYMCKIEGKLTQALYLNTLRYG